MTTPRTTPLALKKNPRSGLTLLEVVIASFIFSGLVTVLSSLWVMHARAQQQSGMMLVAADLADLQMSRALAQGYHGVTASTASFTQTWVVAGQSVQHTLSSSVEVLSMQDNASTAMDMKVIRVTVTFGEDTDQPRTYRLESVLADDGST